MFLYVVIFIIPLTLLSLYFYLSFKAKSKISKYSGFRTKLSMKDQKTWSKAQKLASRNSFIGGVISLILTFIFIKVIGINEKSSLILTIIHLLILIFVSIITQINLKK